MRAHVAEFIGTLALVFAGCVAITVGKLPDTRMALAFGLVIAVMIYVITAVATDTRAIGEAAALAIGGTVTLDALVCGPISGASMNPARSPRPAFVAGDLSHLSVYVAGPILGAALAAVLHSWLRGGPQELVAIGG
jgi:aquaporin NIP